MNLINRVALVTGGAQGIGRAIALALAKEGADIAIADFNGPGALSLAEEIKESGHRAIGLEVDVANATQVQTIVNEALESLSRIDILVNNAGINRDTLLLRMEEEQWDAVLNVNLKGTFLFTRAVLRTMMRQRWGRIISLSSVVGLLGNPGQANYAASKAGIIGFTKTVAKEAASRNITVNAIAPGFIATDMTAKLPESIRSKMLASIAMERFGTPEDVANLVTFLASEKASYLTGQVITLDGGLGF